MEPLNISYSNNDTQKHVLRGKKFAKRNTDEILRISKISTINCHWGVLNEIKEKFRRSYIIGLLMVAICIEGY